MPVWYKANEVFSLSALRGEQFISCRVLYFVVFNSFVNEHNKDILGNELAAYQKMRFLSSGKWILCYANFSVVGQQQIDYYV